MNVISFSFSDILSHLTAVRDFNRSPATANPHIHTSNEDNSVDFVAIVHCDGIATTLLPSSIDNRKLRTLWHLIVSGGSNWLEFVELRSIWINCVRLRGHNRNYLRSAHRNYRRQMKRQERTERTKRKCRVDLVFYFGVSGSVSVCNFMIYSMSECVCVSLWMLFIYAQESRNCRRRIEASTVAATAFATVCSHTVQMT